MREKLILKEKGIAGKKKTSIRRLFTDTPTKK